MIFREDKFGVRGYGESWIQGKKGWLGWGRQSEVRFSPFGGKSYCDTGKIEKAMNIGGKT